MRDYSCLNQPSHIQSQPSITKHGSTWYVIGMAQIPRHTYVNNNKQPQAIKVVYLHLCVHSVL